MNWKTYKARDPEGAARLWEIGLWTRLAFAGVMAAAAGVALIFGSESGLVPGLLFTLGGVSLAATGWHYTQSLLRDEHARHDAAPPAVRPRVTPSRRPA